MIVNEEYWPGLTLRSMYSVSEKETRSYLYIKQR